MVFMVLTGFTQQLTYQADVRYTGQAVNIPIDVDLDLLKREKTYHIVQCFESAHEKIYGFHLPTNLELVNLRVLVEEKKEAFPLPFLEIANVPQPADTAKSGETTIIYQLKEFKDCPMWDRSQLLAGHVLYGPCLITEIDSTTVVLPSFGAEIDNYGNIYIERAGDRLDSDEKPQLEMSTERKHNGEKLDPITGEKLCSASVGNH